jgi:copper resistance protein B
VNMWNVKHLMVGILFSPLAYAGQPMPVSSHAGHDMSAMQQPAETEDMSMTAMEPVITESRTPIRPITDEDRKAAFNALQGHKVHDSSINYFILLDQLEWQKKQYCQYVQLECQQLGGR